MGSVHYIEKCLHAFAAAYSYVTGWTGFIYNGLDNNNIEASGLNAQD